MQKNNSQDRSIIKCQSFNNLYMDKVFKKVKKIIWKSNFLVNFSNGKVEFYLSPIPDF